MKKEHENPSATVHRGVRLAKMEKLLEVWVGKLIINGELEEEDRCYVIYALTQFVESFISYVSLFLLGTFLHKLWTTFWFILFFCVTRRSTGGYHANSYVQCYVGTILIFLFVQVLYIPWMCDQHGWLVLSVLCSFSVLWRFAPINHENWDLDNEEYRATKLKVRRLLVAEMVTIIIMLLKNVDNGVISSAATAANVVALLVIIAKFIGQEVKQSGL